MGGAYGKKYAQDLQRWIPAKQRAIASKGGSASGGNFKNDREKASRAGKKGGQHSTRALIDLISHVQTAAFESGCFI